ncbi:hypothetical protein D3C72_1217400 [compost metagenome]
MVAPPPLLMFNPATSLPGLLARLVIAATPPTPCPAQPPLSEVEDVLLILRLVAPLVAVRQYVLPEALY